MLVKIQNTHSTTTAVPAAGLAKVIPIGSHPKLFVPGTEAIHAEFGWVLVEIAHGNERRIRWYEVTDEVDPPMFDDDGDPVIEAQSMVAHSVWVSVTSLRAVADPDRNRPEFWQRLKVCGLIEVPAMGMIQQIERYVRRE